MHSFLFSAILSYSHELTLIKNSVATWQTYFKETNIGPKDIFILDEADVSTSLSDFNGIVIVISNKSEKPTIISERFYIVSSLLCAFDKIESYFQNGLVDKVFVWTNSEMYDQVINMPLCTQIFSKLFLDYEDNTHLVSSCRFNQKEWNLNRHDSDFTISCCNETRLKYQKLKYNRNTPINEEEMQYLDLLKDVIQNGNLKNDRTGTGTLSKFGSTMRFSLRNGRIPLLTTKKMFWRGIVEELLWFISGSTDAKKLASKGVHIWDANTSRKALDDLGFTHEEEGYCGPFYGFQWRHYGAKYVNSKTDYSGQGIDQLAKIIKTIKTNPSDRRMIMSAWNVEELPNMVLPPCHVMYQFYVANGELSCMMYQRSVDEVLGRPFNLASAALLTHMIAHICNLTAGEVIHVGADCHCYLTHLDVATEQISRIPKPFPTLKIKRQIDSIDDFTFEDFDLIGYESYGALRAKMSV